MDDLISRQMLLEYIHGEPVGRLLCDKYNLDGLIEQFPSAQPRGKWIKTARWGRVYYCNQCRNYLDFDGVNAGRGSTNFCPNCGADMKGEQNEDY